jgi:lysozyme family protein
MTQAFLDALTFTLKWEGGFTDNPSDPGNWTGGNVGVGELKGTKWGISAASFPHLDIKNLTVAQAADIYKTRYWEAISGDSRPYPEALVVFDFAVNSGVSRALAMWNRTPDVREYLAARLDFLASLSTFNTFGRGWVRRVNDLTKLVNELDKNPDVEVVQLYVRDREFTFRPTKTTIGKTNAGRIKVMSRLV